MYYAFEQSEKILIGTTSAAAETGIFAINFTPPEEGSYSITAEDSQPVSLVIDWTAPGKPQNLAGVSPDAETINLTWQAPEGETISKYEVYRNGSLIATVSVPSYIDKGLVNQTEYQYQVFAMDQAGNKSDAAELSMFTKEIIQLEISSVNWKGSWDQQNHLNMGSSIDLTICGTPEQAAKTVMEYVYQDGQVKNVETSLTETKNPDGSGTGTYQGFLPIPEGAKTITKITGSIQHEENKALMEAANLPAPINGGLKVQLSPATQEKLGELEGAELSLWSKTKSSGGKTLLTDAGAYVITGLIPAEDYELKLTRGQKNLGAYQNIIITGGIINVDEFNFDQAPASLDIRVVDKENKPIYNALVTITSSKGEKVEFIASGDSGQDGWVRGWADRGKAERAPVVKDSLAGETLKITANVTTAWEHYQSPATATMTLAPGENEITIMITDRPMAALSGTVSTVEGNILRDASVTAFTKIGDFESQRSTTTDEKGKYNLEVIAGEVRLVVTHRLAGSKEFTIENALTESEEKVYDIEFPLEKSITLNVKSKNIGDVDYYYNQLIEPFIKVSITNTRTEKSSKVYGDWFAVPVPDAKPGDEIEITVDGREAGYGKVTDSVKLDENCWARVDVKLDGMGKIKASFVDAYGNSFTEQRVFAQIYRINPDTNELSHVAQNSNNYIDMITDGLEEGRYTIVFHTYPMSSVMTYERLLKYLEGNTTVVEDVEVTDGRVNNIGPVIVNKFEDHYGWYFFKDNEGNGFRASTNEASPGRLVTLAANFSYESDITKIYNDKFYMTIPEGTEYIEDSLTIKLAEGSRNVIEYVGTDEGFIELVVRPNNTLHKIEGSATYQVRILDDPERSNVAARFWAEFRSEGENYSETIGEVNIKVPYLSLYVDSTINDRQVPISGQAPANATIKIYDSSYYLGQVVSGNNGLWKTTVVLPDRGNKATHYLRAETNKSGTPVYSKIQPVYFDPNQPRITKIEFGQTGVFKKGINRGATVRYGWDLKKDHELDVYFDDISRIEDFIVLSGNGTVVAERDQVTYTLSENKVSAVWNRPVIMDEIRISYRVIKRPVKYPEDYRDLSEEVLRSSLPPLWRDATVLGATTTYNEEKEAFESQSTVLLSDGYTTLNTTLEIMDYDGPEILPANSGLPIKVLRKKATAGELADTFELDFIIDRDVILKQQDDDMEKQSKMGIQASKGVMVAAKNAIQFVRMKGTLGAVKGGNKLYELYDSFMTGFDYGKQADDLNRLRAIVDGPCFEPTMREYYRNEIRNAELDLKFSTGYKIFSSIALSVAGKVVPAGWVAEGVSIGTSATGSVAGSLMDEVTETTYKDLKGYIDQWNSFTCQKSKGDPNDSGPDGRKSDGNGPNEGGIAKPIPVNMIDPSGYLYEGVEDNRLEGVKATAFEQIDGEWTFWEAEWFGQENPLITDKEGRYQWDVPEGLWLVMYEKEGYERAFSDVLPVPPPQLEVNIGMISLVPPTVEISAEYGGIVKLVFDKYMDPATIGASTFKVYEKELDEFGNKVAIAGAITVVDAKENPKDETKQLARIFKFTPVAPLETGASYSVWVSDMVRDYAEKTMAEAATEEVTIPEEPVDPPIDPPKKPGKGGGNNDEKLIPEELPIGPGLKVQTIKYQLKANEDANALVVYKRDGQGNLEIVKASAYDPITQTMKFIGAEGADYIVGYHPISFNDIDMWAKDDISYLAARGIVEGVEEGKFEPQRGVTRAEFLNY
ncbi:MAG: S-layer homology domain-containing protein [Bacillota bacterium]